MTITANSNERDNIIERAISVIELEGEDAVRVVDIARHVGVAVSTLFVHFGSREQLIATAQLHRYVRDLGKVVEDLEVAAALSSGREDFRGLILKFVRRLISPALATERRSRLNVAGSAVRDAHLDELVGSTHHSLCSGLANAIARALDKGWITESIDANATAHWIIDMLFGRGFSELGQQAFDRRAWDDVALRAVLRTLFND